ncbi:MAG: hypothetical protein ABIQ41_05385 [Gemmatimonadales bacterium]
MNSQTESITSVVSLSDEPDYISLDQDSNKSSVVSVSSDSDSVSEELDSIPHKTMKPIDVSSDELSDGIISEMLDAPVFNGITAKPRAELRKLTGPAGTRITRRVYNQEKSCKDVDVKVIRSPIEDYDEFDDGDVKSKCLLIVPPDVYGVEWNVSGFPVNKDGVNKEEEKWKDVDVKVIRAPIEDYGSSVDDEDVKYKCLMIVPPDADGIEWDLSCLPGKEKEKKQEEKGKDDGVGRVYCSPVSTGKEEKPKMEWRGLLDHDRRPRIYQKVPSCFGRRAASQAKRGRVLDSFTRVKLIRIAWKVGVENPQGYTKDNCKRFIRSGNYYEKYVDGWKGLQKYRVTQYLWNHMLKTNQVDR